jgi:hypothetical protein
MIRFRLCVVFMLRVLCSRAASLGVGVASTQWPVRYRSQPHSRC